MLVGGGKCGPRSSWAVMVSATEINAVAGVIHVEATSFAATGGKISWGGQLPKVLVHDSFGGGKQVYFQQHCP